MAVAGMHKQKEEGGKVGKVRSVEFGAEGER